MFDLVLGHTSFLGHTGYANHAREFFCSLNEQIPVRVRNFAHVADVDYLTQKQRDMLIEQHWEEAPWKVGKPFNREDYKNVVDIVLVETNHYYFYDKYPGPKIAYNVWESTQQPEQFFNCLLSYDQFWVPSQWQRQCSIDQGFPADKVKVVPEGVDGRVFKPLPAYARSAGKKFRFMYFGRWDYRKSTTEVIKAFLEEFKLDEPVELLLSADNAFSLDEYKTTEERLVGYGLCALDDPRVVVVHFPAFEEYVSLLQNGNCFVSCARSEGWNLPLIEAIACGVPTICSNYGAQLEFAGGVSHTVGIIGHKPPEQVFMQDSNVPGTWAEPDFEHLRKVMRDVYNNYTEYLPRAIKGAGVVRETFTWKKAADKAYGCLNELAGVAVPMSSTKLKLNLGCGHERLDGYVNVDKYTDSDVRMDMTELDYPDGSIDEIRSSHSLEHLSKKDARKAVLGWFGKLKQGGKLWLSVPDLEWVVTEWLRKDSLQREGFALDTIFGAQQHDGEFHKTGFTEESLKGLLSSVGLEHVDITKTWSHEQQSLVAMATKTAEVGREVVVIGGFPDTPEKENILRTCFARIKGAGLDVALVTHCPISASLAGIFDYVIFERENILSGDWDLNFWYSVPDMVRVLTKYGNGNYQPVAILSSWRNAIMGLSDKYDFMYYIESDTMVNMVKFVNEARAARREGYKCVALPYDTAETQHALTTNTLAWDMKWAMKAIPRLTSWQEYLTLNDDMLRADKHNGDALFELWFANYLKYVGMYDQCKVLPDEHRAQILVDGNLVTRDKVPFRALLSETDDHRVLLFVLNTSEAETIDFVLKYNNDELEKFTLTANGSFWRVFPKHKAMVEVVSPKESVKLDILPDKLYTDTTFSFKHGEFKCFKWSGGSFDDVTKGLNASASFIQGPRLEITGPADNRQYELRFIDKDVDQAVYTTQMEKNHWASANRKYYTNWRLEVAHNNEVVFKHNFDPTGRKVFVVIDSKSLGDTIAWVPYAEEFRKKFNCEVVVSSFWQELYASNYPELEFVAPGSTINGLYAAFKIGCYDNNLDENKHDWRVVPMQQIATDALGLEYVEIKPKLVGKDTPRKIDKPYVCLSQHSTMQAKYWNYPGGWQMVVNYLRDSGYEVVVVSRESSKLKHVRKNTNKPMEETIGTIVNSELYLGVGSGPSWLAWALDVPVVLVSGFSEAFCEFQTGVQRIINTEVCHGCFNDPELVFDRGDWAWCPREKDFECTKTITPDMVIKGVKCFLS